MTDWEGRKAAGKWQQQSLKNKTQRIRSQQNRQNESVPGYIQFKVVVGQARGVSQKPMEHWDLKLKNIWIFDTVISVMCSFHLLPSDLSLGKEIQKSSLTFYYSKNNIFELQSYHPLTRKTLHWQHLVVRNVLRRRGVGAGNLTISHFPLLLVLRTSSEMDSRIAIHGSEAVRDVQWWPQGWSDDGK